MKRERERDREREREMKLLLYCMHMCVHGPHTGTHVLHDMEDMKLFIKYKKTGLYDSTTQ